ncbi:hypothetical protein P186_0942 [Pyrobaculum ferrireducens]|uniref:Uncharacterized protein n=1 Tax=Pyrobaculum ferrireducens TaxID=1104324 RepID=G7VBF3_9CREN|nr:hypothetical protein P186_0942 [Pyrobaculum ferrireducens]
MGFSISKRGLKALMCCALISSSAGAGRYLKKRIESESLRELALLAPQLLYLKKRIESTSSTSLPSHSFSYWYLKKRIER